MAQLSGDKWCPVCLGTRSAKCPCCEGRDPCEACGGPCLACDLGKVDCPACIGTGRRNVMENLQ